MANRSKTSRFILLIFAAILLSGCVTFYNPATERKETLLINTDTEVALGRDMDRQLQNELKILHDSRMEYRLDNIGDRVATASDRQDLVYHFRIVNDKEFNAFAVPGGFVYVNSGLIETATDDELASVVGHEIGHIAARHSVKRLQATLGYQIIMAIAFGGSNNATVSQAIDIVFQLVSLGYSREDEFLADKLGVKYAKKSNFNPYGMVTFFEKLKREQEKSLNFNIVFLSSHPPIEERIRNVQNQIAANP